MNYALLSNFTFSLEGLKSGRKSLSFKYKNLKIGPSKAGIMEAILICVWETRNLTILDIVKTKTEVSKELNLKLRL